MAITDNLFSFIISAIAGILLKSQEFNFFHYNFCRDIDYLLKKIFCSAVGISVRLNLKRKIKP